MKNHQTTRSFLAKATPLLLATVLCTSESQAAASIVGDTIDIWSIAQSNGNESLKDTIVVTDPGIEYTSTIISDIYTLDFGPSSIELITLNSWFSPWFGGGNPPTALEFRGIDVPGEPDFIIDSVEVRFSDSITPHDSAPLNYPEFSENNVTFGDDFVRLETGAYQFPDSSTVHITMTFIPEPTTGLLTLGAYGIFMLRRQRI